MPGRGRQAIRVRSHGVGRAGDMVVQPVAVAGAHVCGDGIRGGRGLRLAVAAADLARRLYWSRLANAQH